jgi:hypothetical protein
MSWNPWLILLSTLSLLDNASGISPLKNVALLGAESSDWGRSNRRGSALPGVVGETIEATLMLPLLVAGDTSGCGRRCDVVVVGDGVLSTGDGWKAECGGLSTPMPEAAEVSASSE